MDKRFRVLYFKLYQKGRVYFGGSAEKKFGDKAIGLLTGKFTKNSTSKIPPKIFF